MKFSGDFKKIKNNYRSLTLIERLILWMRINLTPIEEIMQKIPSNGRLLDLGCGFGVFSYLFAWRNPGLFVLGVDPSAKRIERAKNVLSMPSNLNFQQGLLENINAGAFDAITIIDVIYFLSEAQQIKLLKLCQSHLKDNGTLIIKTMSKTHRFRYALMAGIAWINTMLFWFMHFLPKRVNGSASKTYGQREALKFYGEAEFRKIIESAGWQTEVTKINSFSIYPNIIFLCRKAS